MLLVLVAASVLNLAYFLPVIMRAFFRPGEGGPVPVRWTLRGPILATAAGTLILGLWTTLPYGPFALATRIAAERDPHGGRGAGPSRGRPRSSRRS